MKRRFYNPFGIIPFNLVGYYKFNDDYNDLIEPKVNLSASNISLDVGKLNSAAYSSGVTANILRNTGSEKEKYSMTNGTSDVDYSFSLWIYATATGSNYGCIFAKGAENSSASGDNAEYAFYLLKNNTLQMSLFSNGTTTNGMTKKTTATLPLNEWVHLVITNSGSTFKIYFNGVSQTVVSANIGSGFVKFKSQPFAAFGLFSSIGVSVAARTLYGKIDDFAIFKNYALTQKDIDWIYNSGNGRQLK